LEITALGCQSNKISTLEDGLYRTTALQPIIQGQKVLSGFYHVGVAFPISLTIS
jgi:hypothetical protein